jgi:hypothetical protein
MIGAGGSSVIRFEVASIVAASSHHKTIDRESRGIIQNSKDFFYIFCIPHADSVAI